MQERHQHVVTVIGAGLAGSEAAWQIAKQGIGVRLIEMRPRVMTKAHRTALCAELVCSNSLRGRELSNAVGLLKEELKLAGSLVMEAALLAEVPAGGALAVDRQVFSSYIDHKIRSHPSIEFHTSEAEEIPGFSIEQPLVVATGPLTTKRLAHSIEQLIGSHSLAFFDAISPIILAESIDMNALFRQSRYNKGGGDDYLNVSLDESQYYAFVEAVKDGEKFGGHEEVEADKVDDVRPFEGCMPIEEMIARGKDTLLFGPMKPVGLRDPRTGKRPFAVVQLRQDDKEGTLWSMVGFQTRLKHPEQLRIFRTLPGLEQAEFVRLGSVHRNTFINSPCCIDSSTQFRRAGGLFFAGQITGVEGYVESTASGLVAGVNAGRLVRGLECLSFPSTTAIGSLLAYISDPHRTNFQPMNISFGLMSGYSATAEREDCARRVGKKDRRLAAASQALRSLEAFLATSFMPQCGA